MSVTAAIRDRDVTELPSKRDEDWRWTDLRGLIRILPTPSQSFEGELGAGPFDELVTRVIKVVNGSRPPKKEKKDDAGLQTIRSGTPE